MSRYQDWVNLNNCKIAAIETTLIDRQFVLLQIYKYSNCQNIYFTNIAYKIVQKVHIHSENENVQLIDSQYSLSNNDRNLAIAWDISRQEDESIIIFEGLGQKIDDYLCFEINNYYFSLNTNKIILLDENIDIPISIYSIVPLFKFEYPSLKDIYKYIQQEVKKSPDKPNDLAQAFLGLSTGEIKSFIKNNELDPSKIITYKTNKLLKKGLSIVPPPDIENIGGLCELEKDLQKIKLLFSQSAKERGLRPPRACALLGLPGTGKSLVAKIIGKQLSAVVVGCEWNNLLESDDIAKSLANLDYLLSTVDSIGNCVLYFEEFEKAFYGWDSNNGSGVAAKMAGKLLTWMQDHESPVIMLVTINRLNLLPVEIIRRFEYAWWLDSNLHNGAQLEVFTLHIEKHFPGYCEDISDTSWRLLFSYYRGCSPDEIGKAVARTHHDLFFHSRHLDLNCEELVNFLIEERKNFQPALYNKTISNSLSEMMQQASFARPTRGEDTSRFATSSNKLLDFKDEQSDLKKYSNLLQDIIAEYPQIMKDFV